jgi:anti-anti-sigma factor
VELRVTFENGQRFEIREEPTGPSSLTLRLYGEFDLACRERFEDEFARIGQNGVRELVVDLAGLTFIDSSAIRMLLETKQSADRDGLVLFVTLPQNGQVRKVLELTGVAGLLSPGNWD